MSGALSGARQVRAAARELVRRRSFWGLIVLATVLFGLISFQSYENVRSFRAVIAHVRAHPETIDVVHRRVCFQSTCYSIAERNTPSPSDFDPEKMKAALITQIEDRLSKEGRTFSTRRAIIMRSRSLGTWLGAPLFGLLGAMAFGAEARWRLWPVLLARQPKRGALLLAKLAALAVVVILAFFILLLLVSIEDAFLRHAYELKDSGRYTVGLIGGQLLRSIAIAEAFALFAGAIAIIGRSSLAGFASFLGLLVVSDRLIHGVPRLRYVLPTGLVNALITQPTFYGPHGAAWFAAPSRIVRVPYPHYELFAQAPVPVAAVLLLAWGLAACAIAYVVLKRRDVVA